MKRAPLAFAPLQASANEGLDQTCTGTIGVRFVTGTNAATRTYRSTSPRSRNARDT